MTDDAQAALLGRLRKKSHEELLFVMELLLERKPDIGPLKSSPLTALRQLYQMAIGTAQEGTYIDCGH